MKASSHLIRRFAIGNCAPPYRFKYLALNVPISFPLLSANHFSATRVVFKKKGNLALDQFPFRYSNGAEGGTRTDTGLPKHLPNTPQVAEWAILARLHLPGHSSNQPDAFQGGRFQ